MTYVVPEQRADIDVESDVDTDAAPDRPRHETKGERTRRRLLEEAIRQFGEHGYRGTSVSGIARTVGLTQAASYAYFDSKTDLYRAAVDTDAEALIGEARSHVEELPVRQMLPALVAHLVAGLEHHALARRIVSGTDEDGLGRLAELPGFLRIGHELADRLAQEQADGTVRTDVDPLPMARGIQILLFGLVLTAARGGGGGDVQARPEMVEGVMHALDALVRTPSGS